jgi:hypothetical protein
MSKEPILARNRRLRRIGNARVPFVTSRTIADIIPFSPEMLGISIEHHPHGRRELKLSIDTMHIQVVEIPADKLTADEWREIQTARESYASMWGKGNEGIDDIKEDPFDGRCLQGTPYKVWHYMAKIEQEGEPTKTLTLRKIHYAAEELSHLSLIGLHLPDDIYNWSLRDTSLHLTTSLWDEIQGRIQRNEIASFSVISRLGTAPYGVAEKTQRQKEKTAITFAAMILLAASEHVGDMIFAQLRVGFPEKVLSLQKAGGQKVTLAFPRTEDTLGLGHDRTLILDNDHPTVVEYKTNFPGYWLNNEKAAEVLADLVRRNLLSVQELLTVWKQVKAILKRTADDQERGKLVADLQKVGITLPIDFPTAFTDEVRRPGFLRVLTSPRYFKFVTPLFQENPHLRHALIYEAGDGPYSAAMVPARWTRNAERFLFSAKEKYENRSVMDDSILSSQYPRHIVAFPQAKTARGA